MPKRRLIDADKVLKDINNIDTIRICMGKMDYDDYCDEIINIIQNAPVVEEHKSGHWIKVNDKNLHNAWRCSECGHMVYAPKEILLDQFKGCYCGAIMDEVSADEKI